MSRASKGFVLVAVGLLLAAALASPAAAKVFKITIPAHITPNYHDMFPSVKGFVDRLNELGKGQIKAELYHSESLYKVKDIVPALMNGSCEIVFHTSAHTTGAWPEIGGLTLPFLYQDDEAACRAGAPGGPILDLVNQAMVKKHGVRVLAPAIMPALILVTKNKAITSLADLQGLKVRASGKPDAAALKAMGASPNFLASSEIYEALHRGTIDGLVTYMGTIPARNLDEVLGYYIELKPRLGFFGYQLYTLEETLNKWPAEVKQAVLQAAAEYDKRMSAEAGKYLEEKVRPRLEKKMKFVSPSAEAMKEMVALGKKTYGDWLKTVDADFGQKFLELNQAGK